ncbi:hypothetical protein J6590_093988 [Homalodisca vitripennis]|nr:hypothetical protein J6590_093988 [Homalodisca vitripennis]
MSRPDYISDISPREAHCLIYCGVDTERPQRNFDLRLLHILYEIESWEMSRPDYISYISPREASSLIYCGVDTERPQRNDDLRLLQILYKSKSCISLIR